MTEMDALNERISKVRNAINEVIARAGVFTDETQAQIVLALHEYLKTLQTRTATMPGWAVSTDEIRLVSVMFIDIVGSTEIAARLDAEWKPFINATHRRLAQVVTGWDGEIGQYLGDGLLCFFGAHRSRANDAVRAVACARAVQQMIAGYAQEVAGSYNVSSFSVRIGISTGRVVVGAIGTDDKSETLAVGSTTNLAARLQALCPPGGVVIDGATYSQVRGEFQAVEHEPITIKGLDAAVTYYEVTGPRATNMEASLLARLSNLDVPVFGRDDELARIAEQQRLVLADAVPRAVLIFGEVGLGKTRLLYEASRQPEAVPFRRLTLVGHFEQRETDFSLVRNLLTALCGLREGMSADEAESRITDALRSTWPSEEALPAAAVIGYLAGFGFTGSPYVQSMRGSVPGLKDQLMAAWFTRWLNALAESQPLLLLVDDAQWADAASVRLLETLAGNVHGLGLLLVTAARADLRQQWPRFLSNLEPNVTTLTLGQLSPAATNDLINHVMQRVDAVPDTLPELIRSRADGNPLFVEEFMQMLFDNGVFERTDSARWRVNLFTYVTMASALPNGLLGVLQARLDDLPDVMRHTVQWAAVVGQTFWASAVAAIAGNDMREMLGSLVERGIIVQRPESRFADDAEYRFRNTLYHDVAYNMLTRQNRVSYHRQAARWLAPLVRDNPDLLDELAEHYSRADQSIEALNTFALAARHRLNRGLNSESLRMVEQGLYASRNMPREVALPPVCELWSLQARAMLQLGRYSEATAAAQTALMLMNELPPDERLPRERVVAYCTLGSAHSRLGSYDEAMTAFGEAQEQLPPNEPDLETMVLRAFGRLFWLRGYLDESFLYQQRALLLSQQSKDERDLASVYHILGRIAYDRGQFADALDYFEIMHDINARAGHLQYEIEDLRTIAAVYCKVEASHHALQLLDECDAMQAKLGYTDPMAAVTRGLCLAQLGQFDEALALLLAARDLTTLDIRDQLIVLSRLCNTYYLKGDYETCRAEATELMARGLPHSRIFHNYGRMWLGLAQGALGEAEGEATLQAALQSEQSIAGRELWQCHWGLSRFAAAAEAREHHRQRCAELLTALAQTLHSRPLMHMAVLDLRERRTQPQPA